MDSQRPMLYELEEKVVVIFSSRQVLGLHTVNITKWNCLVLMNERAYSLSVESKYGKYLDMRFGTVFPLE